MRTAENVKTVKDGDWDAYSASVKRQFEEVHLKRQLATLNGRYLYHATDKKLEATIRANGLQPRNPLWSGKADASKDGYLSMATGRSGAGAMGGSSILLRMQIGDDIGNWSFRLTGGPKTEVRTQLPIPADRLEISHDQGATWQPLVSAAATSIPAAAAATSVGLSSSNKPEEKKSGGKDADD